MGIKRLSALLAIDTLGANAVALSVAQQGENGQVAALSNARVGGDFIDQGFNYRTTGGVIGMNNASRVVPTFSGQVVGVAGTWVRADNK